ncbi:flavin reductase family protein [Gordonia polyisoprenivorans]|uniref:flavin reductase family protein n=1 Tax=Gordonia polyisoprenivorans TaxID=84595 RepID=UPI001AD6743D|nr:flavin reductase family protein [Gordonia polyisoprenivorans]QTI70702.1 flavin reductase family protein [Gordonia polyisoprenivorans]
MSDLKPVKTGDSAQDTSRLRRLYGRYPTGVAALCALRAEKPVGIVATSFTPVSMDPALVSICVQHTSTTWPQLSEEDHIGISVLSAKQESESRQLAAKNVDRFAGISWFSSESNAVFLAEAAAWLDCSITTSFPAGDHDVVLLQVNRIWMDGTVAPLVFHDSGFRSLVGLDQ